jgi:hypothetical protein
VPVFAPPTFVPCLGSRWRLGRGLLAGLLCFALLAGVGEAPLSAQQAAGECGRGERPWVALTFEGQDWPRALRDNVTADLRAGLRLRGIDVCAADARAARKPVAQVALQSASERVLVSIDVHDAITDKRVLRDVDLRAATPDARGLLLAQAADELLRASWIELSLEDAPTPAAPPPVEITRAIQPTQLRAQGDAALGARAAVEHHSAGQTLVGADAWIDFWLLHRLGAALAVGWRTGLIEHGSDGSITSSAILASADLLTPVWPAPARYNLAVMVGIQAADLTFGGRAGRPLARARERSAVAVTARAGVAGWWHVSDRLRLALELGPGVALRSVSASDNGRDVTGTGGLQLRAALGMGGVF